MKFQRNAGGWELLIDGQPTYIKGVGGTNKMDVAKAAGANACRTWSGNVAGVQRTLEQARANGMYIMQGIGLTKDPKMYQNGELAGTATAAWGDASDSATSVIGGEPWASSNRSGTNFDSNYKVAFNGTYHAFRLSIPPTRWLSTAPTMRSVSTASP